MILNFTALLESPESSLRGVTGHVEAADGKLRSVLLLNRQCQESKHVYLALWGPWRVLATSQDFHYSGSDFYVLFVFL